MAIRSLVILDEPNSNLDNDGDLALEAAIRDARDCGAIVVVAAHRPAALLACDKLLVLGNGVQQAFGPKEDVLRRVTPASRASGQLASLCEWSASRARGRPDERQSTSIPRAAIKRLKPHRIGGDRGSGWAGVGAWAATSQLSGAVIAPGTLVRPIQHQEGSATRPAGTVAAHPWSMRGLPCRPASSSSSSDDTGPRTTLNAVRSGLDTQLSAVGQTGGRARRRPIAISPAG